MVTRGGKIVIKELATFILGHVSQFAIASALVPEQAARICAVEDNENIDPGTAQESLLATKTFTVLSSIHKHFEISEHVNAKSRSQLKLLLNPPRLLSVSNVTVKKLPSELKITLSSLGAGSGVNCEITFKVVTSSFIEEETPTVSLESEVNE
jgi:hypothetical protein